MPMPPGTKLNNVWLDVSLQANAAKTIEAGTMYGMSGFVVDVDDPDSSVGYDALWDDMIQKDQTEGPDILSLDTATSGSSPPEFEVGKIDLFEVFGDNLLGNMQIYKRRELLTFPKRPVAYDTGTDTFYPMDAFKVHIAHGPRVSRPSVAMFGVSSPSMTMTQDVGSFNISNTPTQDQWIFTMYVDVFLYDMWKHLIGVTGTGGDPYQEVSAWYGELMEDKMWEETNTSRFLPVDWIVHCKATWDISVTGEPRKAVLTSD